MEDKLLKSAVKLAIVDPGGTSRLSATMIGYLKDEMIVITAAHGFREYKAATGEKSIEVAIGYPEFSTKAEAKLLGYGFDSNKDMDLAVLSFKTTTADLVSLPVKEKGSEIKANEEVVSIGFDANSSPPVVNTIIKRVSIIQQLVTYVVNFLPVEGRSGGGLFDKEGYLIGTCAMASPQDNEGFFTSLENVHKILEAAGINYKDLKTANDSVPKPDEMAVNESLDTELKFAVGPFEGEGNILMVSHPSSEIKEIAYCKSEKKGTCIDDFKPMQKSNKAGDARDLYRSITAEIIDPNKMLRFRITTQSGSQSFSYIGFQHSNI